MNNCEENMEEFSWFNPQSILVSSFYTLLAQDTACFFRTSSLRPAFYLPFLVQVNASWELSSLRPALAWAALLSAVWSLWTSQVQGFKFSLLSVLSPSCRVLVSGISCFWSTVSAFGRWFENIVVPTPLKWSFTPGNLTLLKLF